VACHRCGTGLLQRFVGEQPRCRAGKLGELGAGTAPQQDGLDQCGCPVAESDAQCGDVGDSGDVGEREVGDLGQGRGTGRRTQVADVAQGEAEATGQEGFTPVIITL
jgi:hypothetical protein